MGKTFGSFLVCCVIFAVVFCVTAALVFVFTGLLVSLIMWDINQLFAFLSFWIKIDVSNWYYAIPRISAFIPALFVAGYTVNEIRVTPGKRPEKSK